MSTALGSYLVERDVPVVAPPALCSCHRNFKISFESLGVLQYLCSLAFRTPSLVTLDFICCNIHVVDSTEILHSCAFDANWLLVKHGHPSLECSGSSSVLTDFLIVAGYLRYVVGIDTASHYAIPIIPTGKYVKCTRAAHTHSFRYDRRTPTGKRLLNRQFTNIRHPLFIQTLHVGFCGRVAIGLESPRHAQSRFVA